MVPISEALHWINPSPTVFAHVNRLSIRFTEQFLDRHSARVAASMPPDEWFDA
jgi:hypothetical protein